MRATERHNVPAFVAVTVLLHVGPNLNFAVASVDRAICRYGLMARIVFLPMFKPTTATTIIFARAIYIR